MRYMKAAAIRERFMPVSITDIVKPVAGAVAPPSGILTDAWQAIIGDRIAVYWLTNAAKLQAKVLAEVEALGLSLNMARIPDRYAFAWFEQATKEDDPEIQSLFARLLARAAAGDGDAGDRRLIDVLSRFTPDDAACLEHICKPLKPPKPPQVVPRMSVPDNGLHRQLTDLLGKDAWTTIEHLTALALIESHTQIQESGITNVARISHAGVGGVPFPTRDLHLQSRMSITATGWALYTAVKPANTATT